jgi:4-diphosphocytidyl-2-C-methyl-D-erythritol kinase
MTARIMTKTVKVRAPAKVNLTFNIKGTMPDGYHRVETLLQAIDLEDELTFSFGQSAELSVAISSSNNVPSVLFPCDESNLIYKAIRLFLDALKDQPTNIHQSLDIKVEVAKHIPIGAGLAGGSADAAAALIAMNTVADQPFGPADLRQLGSQLGADVPFSLQGGTAIGTQRGDALQRMGMNNPLFFCIVKPRKKSVATPWAYQQFDEFKGAVPAPSCAQAAQALNSGDLERAVAAFGNCFEPVIFSLMPELKKLKETLLQLGAWCCHLSGSGPALFAVVANREQAHYIRRKLLKNDDDGFEYCSAFESGEYGPPLEFHIAQSIAEGARVTSSII